jgi:hypothetical protein
MINNHEIGGDKLDIHLTLLKYNILICRCRCDRPVVRKDKCITQYHNATKYSLQSQVYPSII